MVSNSVQVNVVQKVMKGVTTPKLIFQRQQKEESSTDFKAQKLLILNRLTQAGKKFENEKDENLAVSSGVVPEDFMVSSFKFPYATYLSSKMFNTLCENLKTYSGLRGAVKAEQNLMDQYGFYFVLRVLHSNFSALQACSLSLQDLMDQDAYVLFLDTFKEAVVSLINEGFKEEFEGEHQEEMKVLWGRITELASSILSLSINLIYKSTAQIIESLEESIKDGSDLKKLENASIALKYLSTPETCTKMIQEQDEAELEKTIDICQRCCEFVTKQRISDFQPQRIKEVRPVKEIGFIESCSAFYETLCKHLAVAYCALLEAKASKSAVISEADAKKTETLGKVLVKVFSISTSQMVRVVDESRQVVEKQLKYHKDKEDWEGVPEKFLIFSQFVSRFYKQEVPFSPILSMMVNSFAVIKMPTQVLSEIVKSCVSLVQAVSDFLAPFDEHKESLGNPELEKDLTRVYFQDFSRQITWFLGRTAAELILIEQPE